MGEPPPEYTNFNARNPVGSYRRTFTVPEAWKGRQVFLQFDGVDSAFYLWINGQQVGYSEDSRTPAVFDITPLPAGRFRTCWPSKSTATATAATWRTRTSGV